MKSPALFLLLALIAVSSCKNMTPEERKIVGFWTVNELVINGQNRADLADSLDILAYEFNNKVGENTSPNKKSVEIHKKDDTTYPLYNWEFRENNTILRIWPLDLPDTLYNQPLPGFYLDSIGGVEDWTILELSKNQINLAMTRDSNTVSLILK